MISEPNQCKLVPDPPRVVPAWFSLRRMRAMIFCGVVFVVCGVLVGIGIPVMFYVLGGYVSPTADLRLDKRHESATGVVTARKYIAHTHVNNKHPWRIGFRFETPDGEAMSGRGFTFDREIGKKEIGQPIGVEYDPDDPSLSRPAGGSASLFPLWVYVLVGGIFGAELVIGAGLLLSACWRTRAERLLLEYGPGVEAEVLGVRRVWAVRIGFKNPFDVYYRFYDHRGLETVGKDRTYHYRWAEGLSTGDKVGVVYHPDAPETNVLYLHGKDADAERSVGCGAVLGDLSDGRHER